MDSKRKRIRIGITVLASILILLLGYSWLTEFKIKKRRTHYKVWFKEVGWINKGDVITIQGVPKGRIENIELYPDSVIVDIWIEDYKLREGAHAWLESQGIIGQMRLALTLGTGDTLKEWSIIKGVKQKDIGEVVSNLGYFLERSDSLLLEGIKLLTHTSNVLNEASIELRDIFTKTANLIEDLHNSIKDTKGKIDTTTYNLNRIIAKLDSIETSLMKGEGTIGKLINDKELYNETVNTIKELKNLIKEIKEHPENYFQLRVF